jgi:hypothetical protein
MGIEQTEIDALAALRPGHLVRIAREAIAPFVDETLQDRTEEARQDWLALRRLPMTAGTVTAGSSWPPRKASSGRPVP